MTGNVPPKPQEDKAYLFKPFSVPKYRITFKNAGKLADVPGYVWYTPAILYLWGRYSDVNLGDIMQQYDFQVFWYRFDKPIFHGLATPGDNGWNHALWAAREDQWQKLVNAILETVQFDIPNRRLYQYALQQMTIPDPLTMDRQRILMAGHPRQQVYGFAVLSNEGQVAFDTRNSALETCPPVVRFKPDPTHVGAANQLFARGNLTQDLAFERYKEIMVQAQNAAFQQQVNQQRGTR